MGYCLFLKKVRKVIVDNDYMAYPYKIGIGRCIGSCNNENNPYYKFFSPNSIKSISVKPLDLISQRLVFKNISFHQSYKCGCLLDEKGCNNLQKRNKNKFRYECSKIKKCSIGYSWNVNNCRCEMKKIARLIDVEECDAETNEKIKSTINKTIECKTSPTLIKDCKPFIGVSILFLCITIILIGIIGIIFYPIKQIFGIYK